jgi:hypothetical protein
VILRYLWRLHWYLRSRKDSYLVRKYDSLRLGE